MAVRDGTFVAIRMERSTVEVVVSVCFLKFLVVDRGLNPIINNARIDVQKNVVQYQ